jgi:hypothetical protein
MARVLPGLGIRSVAAEMGVGIDRAGGTGRPAVIDVFGAHHGDVFGALGQHVEIAHDDIVVGMRDFGKTEFCPPSHRTAFDGIVGSPVLDEVDLLYTFGGIAMVEMNGINTQRTTRGVNHRLQGRALQVELVIGAGARQQDVACGENRVARQDHIAELQAAHMHLSVLDRRAGIGVCSGTEDVEILAHQLGENCRQIGLTIFGEIACDFLQSDDIGTLKSRCNAFRAVSTVQTEAKLDVKADKFHDIL